MKLKVLNMDYIKAEICKVNSKQYLAIVDSIPSQLILVCRDKNQNMYYIDIKKEFLKQNHRERLSKNIINLLSEKIINKFIEIDDNSLLIDNSILEVY